MASALEDDLNRAIIRTMDNFREVAYKQAMDNLQQSDVTVTGVMKDRIRVDLFKYTDEILSIIEMKFPLSAALTQARRYYAKNADVNDLVQWVLQRGLENFRYVPGYETGQLPSQDRQARRIAWGIKNYKGANRRRKYIKQWLHYPFFRIWASYRDEVIKSFFDISSEASARVFQDAIDNRD